MTPRLVELLEHLAQLVEDEREEREAHQRADEPVTEEVRKARLLQRDLHHAVEAIERTSEKGDDEAIKSRLCELHTATPKKWHKTDILMPELNPTFH